MPTRPLHLNAMSRFRQLLAALFCMSGCLGAAQAQPAERPAGGEVPPVFRLPGNIEVTVLPLQATELADLLGAKGWKLSVQAPDAQSDLKAVVQVEAPHQDRQELVSFVLYREGRDENGQIVLWLVLLPMESENQGETEIRGPHHLKLAYRTWLRTGEVGFNGGIIADNPFPISSKWDATIRWGQQPSELKLLRTAVTNDKQPDVEPALLLTLTTQPKDKR